MKTTAFRALWDQQEPSPEQHEQPEAEHDHAIGPNRYGRARWFKFSTAHQPKPRPGFADDIRANKLWRSHLVNGIGDLLRTPTFTASSRLRGSGGAR